MKTVEEVVTKIGAYIISDAFKELLVLIYAHFHLAEFSLKGGKEKERVIDAVQRLHRELQQKSMGDIVIIKREDFNELVPQFNSPQPNSFLQEARKAAKLQSLEEGIEMVKAAASNHFSRNMIEESNA